MCSGRRCGCSPSSRSSGCRAVLASRLSPTFASFRDFVLPLHSHSFSQDPLTPVLYRRELTRDSFFFGNVRLRLSLCQLSESTRLSPSTLHTSLHRSQDGPPQSDDGCSPDPARLGFDERNDRRRRRFGSPRAAPTNPVLGRAVSESRRPRAGPLARHGLDRAGLHSGDLDCAFAVFLRLGSHLGLGAEMWGGTFDRGCRPLYASWGAVGGLEQALIYRQCRRSNSTATPEAANAETGIAGSKVRGKGLRLVSEQQERQSARLETDPDYPRAALHAGRVRLAVAQLGARHLPALEAERGLLDRRQRLDPPRRRAFQYRVRCGVIPLES